MLTSEGPKFEAESGKGVLGEGRRAPSPPATGLGQAFWGSVVSAPSGVRSRAPTANAYWMH